MLNNTMVVKIGTENVPLLIQVFYTLRFRNTEIADFKLTEITDYNMLAREFKNSRIIRE